MVPMKLPLALITMLLEAKGDKSKEERNGTVQSVGSYPDT